MERETVHSVCQVFVEKIAIFVFFGARIEQRGAILKAKTSNPLLHEIQMFISVVLFFFQVLDVISFRYYDDYVQAEIVSESTYKS